MSKNASNQITKQYRCPVCKKNHFINFKSDFADNRPKYPFTYVYMHKFENPANLEDVEKEVLTTLYLDAHLNIRGVEAVLNDDQTNIVSKETSSEIIDKLTKVILEMQAEMDEIQIKYNQLKEKYEKSG